jgi:hypothetical protein
MERTADTTESALMTTTTTNAAAIAHQLGGHLHSCPVDGLSMVVPDPTATTGSVVVPLTRSFWLQSTMPTTVDGWEDAIVDMVEAGEIEPAI